MADKQIPIEQAFNEIGAALQQLPIPLAQHEYLQSLIKGCWQAYQAQEKLGQEAATKLEGQAARMEEAAGQIDGLREQLRIALERPYSDQAAQAAQDKPGAENASQD